MAHSTGTALSGDALPLRLDNSSDYIALDYQLGMRRKIVQTSAAAYTVKSSDTGAIVCFGGCASTATITLPAPEDGLWYTFICTGAPNASATVFTCASTDAFILAGITSAGVGTIQAETSIAEFTAANANMYYDFIGLSTSRYLVRAFTGGSSVASTGHVKGAS